MLKITFTSLLLLSITIGFSQLSTFNIADYKLTDYKYQSLNTIFGTGGDYSANSFNDNLINNTSSKFNLGINAFYELSQNSRRHQKNLNVTVSFNPGIKKSATDQKIFFMRNVLSFGYNDRYYYNEKRYLEYGIRYGFYHFYSKSKFPNAAAFKDYEFSDKTTLSIFHGHGRVEDVTNAWKAHRLLKDFEKMGLVDASSIQNEDIVNLADLMVEQEQTRFFDNRLKRIEDLTGLGAFFESKNIGNNSIAMFTALYDNYLYGVQNRRFNGHRFSYGFDFVYDHKKTGGATPMVTQRDFPMALIVKYENFKPLKNNDFQFDYFGGIELKDFDVAKKIDSLFLTTTISASLAYYPTTRTTLSSSLIVSHEAVLERKDNSYRVDWKNNFYYYFSPKVRLSSEISLSNRSYNSEYMNGLTKSKSFGLRYYLNFNIALF